VAETCRSESWESYSSEVEDLILLGHWAATLSDRFPITRRNISFTFKRLDVRELNVSRPLETTAVCSFETSLADYQIRLISESATCILISFSENVTNLYNSDRENLNLLYHMVALTLQCFATNPNTYATCNCVQSSLKGKIFKFECSHLAVFYS